MASRIWTSTVVVRRTALGKERFDLSLTTAEDRDLWVRLVAANSVCLLSEPLATAVLEENSLSRSDVECDYQNMLKVVRRYGILLGRAGLRKWETAVFRALAADHLGHARPRAAVRPACKRLWRQPWSAEAWWIVFKAAGLACTARFARPEVPKRSS